MKASLAKNLVLVMATAIALIGIVTPLPCGAAENEEGKISEHRGRELRSRRVELSDEKIGRVELSDEKIERVMNRLRKDNPQEAEELERIRRRNPDRFEDEIRKLMRKYFSRKPRARAEKGPARRGDDRGRREKSGRPARGRRAVNGPRERLATMLKKHSEFLKWLEEDYPEEGEKITALKETNPELCIKKLAFALKKYRRIFEASKENPQLAEVLKQNLELNEQKEKLLKKIKAADDKDRRHDLMNELQEVLSLKFDLIVRRKEMRYESLLERLKKLEDQVMQSRAKIKKWKDPQFKKENVKARTEEILGKGEKFEWD